MKNKKSFNNSCNVKVPYIQLLLLLLTITRKCDNLCTGS